MNDFAELAFMETPLIDAAGFMELILRFVLNMVVCYLRHNSLPDRVDACA